MLGFLCGWDIVIQMVVMGTFPFHIRRQSFLLWPGHSLTFSCTLDIWKSSSIFSGGKASSCFRELLFWTLLGMCPEATWCQTSCFVRFTHKLQILLPSAYFYHRSKPDKQVASHQPTSQQNHFLPFTLSRNSSAEEKGVILIKEIGGVSNKTWTERHSAQKWSPPQSACLFSVSFLKHLTSSEPGLLKPHMFLKAQGCLWW